MTNKKWIIALAATLVTASSVVTAAPWHHPEVRPVMQVQIDTAAVQANLEDAYASLAGIMELNDKTKAVFDRYVQVRIKADVEHAQWHNQHRLQKEARQAVMAWRLAHDELKVKLNGNVVKLRGELVAALTPEQLAKLDRYEPAAMRGCGMGRGMGWGPQGNCAGHRMGYRQGPGCNMAPDCMMHQGPHRGYHMQGPQDGRGPGCRW